DMPSNSACRPAPSIFGAPAASITLIGHKRSCPAAYGAGLRARQGDLAQSYGQAPAARSSHQPEYPKLTTCVLSNGGLVMAPAKSTRKPPIGESQTKLPPAEDRKDEVSCTASVFGTPFLAA